MKCQLVDKFILDYCDNTLSPDLTREIDEHLKECTMCSHAVSLLKAENLVLYNLEKFEPSADFTDKVMQSIRSDMTAHQPHRLSKKSRIPYYLLIPAAAAVLLILTVNLPAIFNMGTNNEVIVENQKMTKEAVPLNQEIHIADNTTIFMDREPALGTGEVSAYSGNQDTSDSNQIMRSSNKEDTSSEEEIIRAPEDDAVLYYSMPELSSRAESISMASLAKEKQIELNIQNMPEEYILFEIIEDQENSITYCYADETNTTTLDITITEIANEETSNDEENLEKARVLSEQSQEPEASSSPLNILSWVLEKDNKSYIISIHSNMSKENLYKLYSSITFTK